MRKNHYLYFALTGLIAFNSLKLNAQEGRVYDTPPSEEEISKTLFPELSTKTASFIRGNTESDAGTPKKSFGTRSIHMLPSATDPQPSAAQVANSPPPTSQTSVIVQVPFAPKSATITSAQAKFLDPVGKGLVADSSGKSKLIIEGHTDNAGSAKYNQQLSQRRAESARKYLIDTYKISPERLTAVGKGQNEPLIKDNPSDPRNRRIEFVRR